MTETLIKNALVLQVSDDRQDPMVKVLTGCDILLLGDSIEGVQPTGSAADSDFDVVIDATGLLAMPGLINTHAHVPMGLFRGLAEDVTVDEWFNDYIWQLESNLEPEDVYWGTLLGIIEMIESGVTSVADHYFFMDETARAVEESGFRALLGWAIFGTLGDKGIADTAEYVTRWQGKADGRIRTLMAPHAPYTCDDDYLRKVADKAAELDVMLHIHVSETVDQTEASLKKRGVTPIQVLEQTGVLDRPCILAHASGATAEDIALLSKYQVGIAHAPKTYLKLGHETAPVLEFRAADIPLGLATDGAASNATMNLWEPLRIMALSQKRKQLDPTKMPIAEALHVATRDSARVFGLPRRLGAVEAGRLADIILVDLSGTHHQPLHNIPASLVYNIQPSDVQTVIINGRVVMQNRELLTIDRNAVFANVRKRMARLARRNPDRKIQSFNI